MLLNSRTAFLALAENEAVKHLLMRNGLSKGFVRRFIAGETLADALVTAKTLQTEHIRVALDLLGENVITEAEAIAVGSSRVDLQACKLEYSIVSPK